ncbi:MAG: twin-arginine translocation signal domain-containing protein [Ilumatobacter sp.]|nr:twin-arginine translocation signal domain-containing protein [Ilumatobacter sp.]
MHDRRASRRSFVGGAVAMAAGLCGCGLPHPRDTLTTDSATGDAGMALRRAPRLGPIPSPRIVADGVTIHPRDAWGADLAPRGTMGVEDVRFLLVHHTQTSNVIPDPVALMRGVYAFHTGSAKRWNDVAYNFFVAPDGSIWEGRHGSLDGPVVADATGGNQGFSQLVCLLGDFTAVEPTAAAQDALVRLLAYLAVRYELSTWQGATATFTSRGSNKFPAGAPIVTPTISGHRDVTHTTCPGDAGYRLLSTWRRAVHPLVAATWQRPGLQRASRLDLRAP